MLLTVSSGVPGNLTSYGFRKSEQGVGPAGGMGVTVVAVSAKQRASMKWLLSKAFNNKVPDNLKEPFYRDHENQEHLKPQLAGGLANCELYCSALANIYSDPGYNNLNHSAILQTLARKGVLEPSDDANRNLTETTLIQTNPLRMAAHMAVIDHLMRLYAREVATPERVQAAAQRFVGDRGAELHVQSDDPEQLLLAWVGGACVALTERLNQEAGQNGMAKMVNGGGDAGDELKSQSTPARPPTSPPTDLRDLSGGRRLCALLACYCPQELRWADAKNGCGQAPPSVQDSLHNIRLVKETCSRCLLGAGRDVFHVQPEDIVYMRSSMKQNLVVLLADLFNVLEINPAKCVQYPGMDPANHEGTSTLTQCNLHGVTHKRNLLQTVMVPIPDLRQGIDDPDDPTAFQVSRSTLSHLPLRKTNSLQQSMSDMTEDSLRRGSEESFVVHRGKNIPTLKSVVNDEPLIPARLKVSKEKHNNDSKADERGEIAAGRPSNWEENRKSTYAGRRSRRNSMSEDSQLTIENFGGSQDNLNFIGRNPDKEVAVHIGRKTSVPTYPVEKNSPLRSTLQDARGSFTLGYDDDYTADSNEKKEVTVPITRKISAPSFPVENLPLRSSLQDARGSFQLGYDDFTTGECDEKQDNGNEKAMARLKRQLSSDDIAAIRRGQNSLVGQEVAVGKENVIRDLVDGEMSKRMSFADLGKQKVLNENRGIQLVYMNDKEEYPSKSSFLNKVGSTNGNEKKTTFATLPNTTTWQQQSTQQQLGENKLEETSPSNVMTVQLNDIRMKLEEKRRHIENEKRRMEVAMNKQRQKVGKAAFLQAVAKGRGNLLKSAEAESNNGQPSNGNSNVSSTVEPKPQRPFSLQEIGDDVTHLERKWADENQPYVETRRTPDLENMDLETYQQSIAQMNSSLHDLQSDMQRLATQQSQLQQQTLIAQQQRQIQQLQQQYQSLHPPPQRQQYAPPQQTYQPPQQVYQQPVQQGYAPPLQSSASAPHIPASYHPPTAAPPQQQFFLHDPPPAAPMSPQPPPPQRRTWAQSAPVQVPQPELRTWGRAPAVNDRGGSAGAGFLLHDTSDRYDQQQQRYHQSEPRYGDSPRYSESPRYAAAENSTRYQNGDGGGDDRALRHSNSFTLSQQHLQQQQQQHFGTSHSTPTASPQHRNIHRQISQLLDESKRTPVSLQHMDSRDREPPQRKSSVTHAPIPAPSADDMEPQNISFIGTPSADKLSEGLSRLNITSGSRTYRIPSPTRPPPITRSSFHQPSPSPPNVEAQIPPVEVTSLDGDPSNQKGFYISFDDDSGPRRPKPPLRQKRMSPKKERSYVESAEETYERKEDMERMEKKQLERELQEERTRRDEDARRQMLIEQEREKLRAKREASQERQKVNAASAIIIGNELSNPDPDLDYERERKKEKIMLLSLQRRQRQEEAKARKEAEAQERREREKQKEEERARKKEEREARRQAILEQYKLKKAIEEAEREGKTLDRSELSSLKPTPKMRPKASTRPRPKTIHIDSGSVQMAEGMSSRGKKGSTSNLTDSPDDSRGVSPCHSSNQTLGRRSSYKTSRDPSPAQVRGRPKYTAYQNFKGRKSSSMMNLYGSSTDHDGATGGYRYGDTDSGLGRATPPRRAPSPGGARHLPSPSGPGSLPGGFVSRAARRTFDDGASDISSTPSSMMDYNGPRLYKQPATKSNRSIMLNAVEYCVFPGVVNREAKRRVLEEINRSESKHFLVLFRDAGCQFRALYSYCPEREEILKLYGTGPRQVNDKMFDKFFKYNSGGKCFSQVHTKHLSVTIDAFTIHNSLWQGKKVNLPNKKDMALVI
ncbi:unnamed protein product [Acanthoscelides obtectus]|uniref:Patronin n=1 Tax=Acanthoscelides obtectus TaxID=200917 RepID=A0A9P0LTT2_ACAOB|nr:unnamed protein product [Acanthoscelides obtectus]CAK1662620.1 Patronin [Acanthoscelides obtectus]